MRSLFLSLAASVLPLEASEPPERPAERFTVFVEAADDVTLAPGESIERVLEQVASGLKKRKRWLFVTNDPEKAEVFVRVHSHRIREEHRTTLVKRVKFQAKRESRDDIQAIDIVDYNIFFQSHYVLATVSVLGFGLEAAGYDGREKKASLERASEDLGVRIEELLRTNYGALVEKRRLVASRGLDLSEPTPSKPAPAPLSLDPTVGAYLRSVERYRRGDFARAARELSSLTREELYRASTVLLGGERTSAEWKAAALLHTECVLAPPTSASSPVELARRTALHLETAKRYVQAIADPVERARFQKLWHLATAYHFHAAFQSDEALSLLSWGLRLFPADTDLLFAYGAFQEAAGALKRDRDRLAEAEEIYRHLSNAGAGPHDLDVRFAHVLLEMGRLVEADARLESARRSLDGSDAALAAWMIEGELARRRGDWKSARVAFASAREIDPGCQACAVALAAAHERLGAREAGSELVARWLESPLPSGHDAWWRFLLGPAVGLEAALAELRSGASAP